MINNNNDKEPIPESPKEKSNVTDTARMDVQCHLIIKDKDSGEILLNRRG